MEIHVMLDHVRHGGPCLSQDTFDRFKCIARLCGDVRTDDLSVLVERHLTTHKDEIPCSDALRRIIRGSTLVSERNKFPCHDLTPPVRNGLREQFLMCAVFISDRSCLPAILATL